jgi:hypothetical protein
MQRELAVLEQKGLLVGMVAWRLIISFIRRLEDTAVDDEGGSGHTSTIEDDNQSRATVDALPREASVIPYRCTTLQPTSGSSLHPEHQCNERRRAGILIANGRLELIIGDASTIPSGHP